ncbi:hypothetical protein LHYA1_G008378 [Lachnellula hyalina]|uniref:Heterokaryon incompatibility domain-containing protein n=1 Tax=Lachnellula hyalina TaxID=1316788 RepID=A0A8H8QVI0_9HELO|nr:uncharacterized protein LHYA1_G008378 [Lachnellula hyalina]TVY23463.1 hypothetical protein LHYA1_G008378 [Lachnellula hyalina]
MLCILCQNIQFKLYLDLTREEKFYLLSFCDEWQFDNPDDYSEDAVLNTDLGLVGGPHESFYFHHRNLGSLQKAADDGCNFCYQIFYGLLGTTTEVNHSIASSSERLYLFLQAPDFCAPESEHLYIGDLGVRFGKESLGHLRLKNLNDLGDRENSQNISISVGEDRVGSYAALSYCWGKAGSRNYLTTKDNLEMRQKAVDVSTFPKTFNDAIVVCRYLDIRFLWIDSLCIVQDSKSDWQTQSQRMGDIYSNAALTISAAVGEDSHAGLFVDRDARKTYPCTLDVQYPKEDGVIRKGAFLICRDWYMPEPVYLDTRGWTFQEKYLSTRTLSFSKTEIYWNCASKTASEGLPMGLVPLNNKSDFDRYIKVDAKGNFSTRVHMRQRFHWWYQTMEIYSYRIFTHESDRLIALAGLASKFKTSGDSFLYGLWKSDLAHGLAWRLSADNKETGTDISLTSPIPSWSWASRPGKIITYYDSYYGNDGTLMECNKSITSIGVSGDSLLTTPFEVLNADPMPLATHLAASSTRPSLKLRGLVRRIIPAKSCAAYNENVFQANQSFALFRYAFSSKNRTCKQFLAFAFYDEAVTKGDNLYCLPLIPSPSSEHKDARRFSCLLLKKVDAGVKFRRVGYLDRSVCSFDGVSPTILEII